MDDFTKAQKGTLTKPFNIASDVTHPHVKELVRHLARIAAAQDFKKLHAVSKVRYNLPPAKGKNS